jgi:hypothetical protein
MAHARACLVGHPDQAILISAHRYFPLAENSYTFNHTQEHVPKAMFLLMP